MLLEVRNLTVWYGALRAVHGVNFEVYPGESVALLGPNGAGKTTVLRAIVGVLPDFRGRIEQGEILFQGSPITGTPTHELVKRGIGYVPQGKRVFPNMTVKENLEMGGFVLRDPAVLKRNLQRVFHLFPILQERQKQRARTLSGGEQQMLAIARALMVTPKILLLDEPLLGLSPNYIKEVMEKVQQIQREGVGVVIVEHNAKVVLNYVDRVYVLAMGEVVLQGPAQALAKSEKLHQILGLTPGSPKSPQD